MLHQPIVEDPDVANAVREFRGPVIEIRAASAALAGGKLPQDQADALRATIDDHVDAMTVRCDRLAITIDDLFRRVNDDLRRDPVPNDHRPHGDHLQQLLDEVNRAYAVERTTHRQISRLQAQLPALTSARIAADRACAGFVAGWPDRGRTFSGPQA